MSDGGVAEDDAVVEAPNGERYKTLVAANSPEAFREE